MQVSCMSFVEINSLGIAENMIIFHGRLVATASNETGKLEAAVLRSLWEAAAAERKGWKAKSGG